MNTLTLVKDHDNTYRLPTLRQREAQAIRENAMAVLETIHRGRIKVIDDRLAVLDKAVREVKFRIGVAKARLLGTDQFHEVHMDLQTKLFDLREEGDRLEALKWNLNRQHDAAISVINGDTDA
jgi:hypothetical protein